MLAVKQFSSLLFSTETFQYQTNYLRSKWDPQRSPVCEAGKISVVRPSSVNQTKTLTPQDEVEVFDH